MIILFIFVHITYIRLHLYFVCSSSSNLFSILFFSTNIIVSCYIELSFGCCDAQISPFVGLTQEHLILILRSKKLAF